MRVNMNINDELLKRLDNYAKKHYMSRSTVMCQACDEFLTSREITDLLSTIRDIMQKIANSQHLDDETLKQFDDLSRFVDMINFKK